MHESSMRLMEEFVRRYLPVLKKETVTVADIGSCDRNGCYRQLFNSHVYTGLDLHEGENVDRIVEEYAYGDIQYDVVVSGQVMEHVEDLVRWRDAIVRLVRPGGLLCIIAPHTWPHHAVPSIGLKDCWRIFPDGMRWLFRELDILVCEMNGSDTWIVARRPG